VYQTLVSGVDRLLVEASQLQCLGLFERARDQMVELTADARRLHVALDQRVRQLRDLWGLAGRTGAMDDAEEVP
jgi:hypothetical protein